MSENYHEYAVAGGVAHLWFNRPERRNATNPDFYRELNEFLDRAVADRDVSVVVLGARGPVFCAGQDLKWSANITPAEFDAYERGARRTWERIRRLTKPVVARVHGHAYGGGMYIATSCDLIAMHAGARMAMREIKAGSQCGGQHLFTVGRQRSLELSLLAKEVTGSEAERWNLVNACCKDEDELDRMIGEWCETLQSVPPLAVAETKRATNFLLDAAGVQLHAEADFGRHLSQTRDFQEAKDAWVERRKPVFRGE